MIRKEQAHFKRNAGIIIAAIISMLIMVGLFNLDGAKAEGDQISVIKVNGTTARVPDTTNYYSNFYYIFAAVDSNGDVLTDISGNYGHFTFKRGVSEPETVRRAINPTEYTEYEDNMYVVGLPEGATLKVIGVRVRQKPSGNFLMLEEADISENTAKPYPTIGSPTYEDNMTCIQPARGNILWAAFRLVDDDGNLVDRSGTYGGITFKNGVSAKGDSSRQNENITVSEGSTSGYPPGDYWCYLMGNDDIFIITDLPAGVHIENVAQFGTDVCGPTPDAPAIKEYPRTPEQNNNAEYRVRHWQQTAEGVDNYELKDVDVLEGEVGSTVTATPKSYSGYAVNSSKSNNSGTVLAAEASGYPLVLNLYYDKVPPAKYTVEFYFEQTDGSYLKDGHKDGETYSYEAMGPVGEDPDINIPFFGSDYNYNSEKSTPSGIIKADGSLVLKLYYDLPKATLSYNLNGVGDGDEIPSETVVRGSTVTVADPTDAKYGLDIPEGYSFNGWSYYDSDADETMIHNPGDTFELYADLELNAEWDIDYDNYNYYSIHHFYETDDGSYEERDWETEWGLLGKIGETVTATPNSDNNWYEYYPAHPNNKASGTVSAGSELELNLYYKQKKYTLSYDGNGATGGTAPASASASYEGEVTVADNTFEKDGHEFTGWKDQHGKEYSEKDKITLDENKVLSAQWNKVNIDANYTVEHYKENLGGGYHKADTEHLSGNIDTTVSATPKHYDHYTYDNTQGKASGTITTEGDLVLKLYYNLNEYTLTYNGNGADSGSMDSKTAKYESTFALASNAFTREGYSFTGWDTTKEGGGKEYADKANFTMAEDTVLYAQWKKLANTSVVSPSIKKNIEVVELAPEEDETFEFTLTADSGNPKTPSGLGHKARITGEGSKAAAFGSAITFDKAGEYTFRIKEVKGNAEGYTYDESEHVWKVTVTAGSDGYVISGNTIDGDSAVDGGSITFKNTYTKKEDTPTPVKDTYKITYKLDGGTYNGSTNDIVEEHEADTVIKLHAAPEKEGYEFLYWDSEEYAPGKDYKVEDNHTFTAKWKKNDDPAPVKDTHKITYNLNGGTYKGKPGDIVEEHKVGSVIKVHEAPDAREGYTFAYWQGSRYQPGDEYTVKEDHTFTAIWVKNNSPDDDSDNNNDNDNDTIDDGDNDDNNDDNTIKKKEKKLVSPKTTTKPTATRVTSSGTASTGDDINLALWLASVLTSLIAVAGSAATRKR